MRLVGRFHSLIFVGYFILFFGLLFASIELANSERPGGFISPVTIASRVYEDIEHVEGASPPRALAVPRAPVTPLLITQEPVAPPVVAPIPPTPSTQPVQTETPPTPVVAPLTSAPLPEATASVSSRIFFT